MRYTVVNELSNFQFHDAELKSIDFEAHCMKWEVAHINAMTSNSKNELDVDMCIDNAIMVFNDIAIESVIYGAYTERDSSGNITEHKPVTIKSNEHLDTLRNIPNEGCYLYAMEELVVIDKNRYKACFHIDFNTFLTFTFSQSIISWNGFIGKAWYEDEKWKTQPRT